MLLALHPHEQRALQSEVDAVLQGRDSLAYEDLDELVLCHGAMNEALRLFPPVVIIPKVAAQDGVEVTSAEVGTKKTCGGGFLCVILPIRFTPPPFDHT